METTREYVLNGVKIHETMVPDMYVVVDSYRPPQSCTPWDYYGNSHQKEIGRVLKAEGIEFTFCNIRETKMNPRGSGPGGRVRFGDSMMPGEYRIAVRKRDVEKATAAIERHKKAVIEWLEGNGPKPQAVG